MSREVAGISLTLSKGGPKVIALCNLPCVMPAYNMLTNLC